MDLDRRPHQIRVLKAGLSRRPAFRARETCTGCVFSRISPLAAVSWTAPLGLVGRDETRGPWPDRITGQTKARSWSVGRRCGTIGKRRRPKLTLNPAPNLRLLRIVVPASEEQA